MRDFLLGVAAGVILGVSFAMLTSDVDAELAAAAAEARDAVQQSELAKAELAQVRTRLITLRQQTTQRQAEADSAIAEAQQQQRVGVDDAAVAAQRFDLAQREASVDAMAAAHEMAMRAKDSQIVAVRREATLLRTQLVDARLLQAASDEALRAAQQTIIAQEIAIERAEAALAIAITPKTTIEWRGILADTGKLLAGVVVGYALHEAIDRG